MTDILFAYLYNSMTAAVFAFLMFLLLGQTDMNIYLNVRRDVWFFIAFIMILPFKLELPKLPLLINSPFSRLYIFASEKIPSDDIMECIKRFFYENSVLGLTFIEITAIVWVIMAVGFFVVYILNYIIFIIIIIPFCRPVRHQIKRDICKKIYDEFDIQKTYPVYYCLLIKQPVIVGILRQKILIPYRSYSTGAFYFMMKRQIIHCIKGHIRIMFLMRVANALHWFNPFSYKIIAQFRKDIQGLCTYIMLIPLSKNGIKVYYETVFTELKSFEDSFKYNSIF